MNSRLAVDRNRKVAALSGPVVPRLVAASGTDATMRFLNFFATQIENDNTRAAYLRAVREFLAFSSIVLRYVTQNDGPSEP